MILNLGKLTIRPNAEMRTAAWLDLVNHALAQAGTVSGDTKAAYDAARKFQSQVRRPGTVTITSCFDGPWDGNTMPPHS